MDRDIDTRNMKMQMTDVDEEQVVNNFLHDIEDSDNGYEDEAMCCNHANTNVHILYTMNKNINAEPKFVIIFTVNIQTIYKLDEGLFMHVYIHNDGTVHTEVIYT